MKSQKETLEKKQRAKELAYLYRKRPASKFIPKSAKTRGKRRKS